MNEQYLAMMTRQLIMIRIMLEHQMEPAKEWKHEDCPFCKERWGKP